MNYGTIICGCKGLGKSTFSVKKWPSHLLIECDISIFVKTFSLIEQTLYSINGKHYLSDEKLLIDFINIVKRKTGIIIDNSELIDENTLKLIVNIAKQQKRQMVFIFDVPYQKIYESNTFLKLVEWDIIDFDEDINDFRANIETLREFVTKRYPLIKNKELDTLIKITGYNFNEIKKLMWINKIKCNNDFLSNEAVEDYYKNRLEDELANIPPVLVDVLKKASIIGEIFEKYPLERKNGFNILGISDYLNDLENAEIFISKYLSKKDYFKFVNNDLYKVIISSIASFQKIEWYKILEKYYIQVLDGNSCEYTKLEALNKAKNSALKLNDFQKVLEANQVLLFQYINNNDLLKAIATIDEILDNTQIKSDKNYIDYLLSIKMQILIEVGEYRKALKIVELFLSDLRYRGSEDYLKYYYARCLYDCGDIDSAYNETIGIIKKIKKTSLKGNSNQKIYPQIYSLMASIQNHLNLDDDGIKYYKLALNYSFNLIDDKALYFDILSKCDMFFSIEKSQLELTKCAAYYQKTGNKFKSAKVYFNLATELLFNRSDVDNEIEYLFKIAKNTFNIPDENLAYVKNNIAIYYILVKNDLPSAIIELESALFVNLSEFTYMTIFLNLSMSYFIAYGGNNEKFKKTYE